MFKLRIYFLIPPNSFKKCKQLLCYKKKNKDVIMNSSSRWLNRFDSKTQYQKKQNYWQIYSSNLCFGSRWVDAELNNVVFKSWFAYFLLFLIKHIKTPSPSVTGASKQLFLQMKPSALNFTFIIYTLKNKYANLKFLLKKKINETALIER